MGDPSRGERGRWNLRIHAAGQIPKSLATYANLKRVCEQDLAGQHTFTLDRPAGKPPTGTGRLDRGDHDLRAKFPELMRRIIGDFPKTERVRLGPHLRPDRAPKE